MKSILILLAIAENTFRETIRDQVLYVLLVFAVLATLGSIILGSLSVGQNLRILEDLGVSTISLIGGLIAIFVGGSLIYKEIDRKTIYLMATKPIERWQFIVGKFLGLSWCLAVVMLAMGTFLVVIVACLSHSIQPGLIGSLALVYLELLLIVSTATFFSTFSTPVMSVMFTTCTWFTEHLSESLRMLGKLSNSHQAGKLFDCLYYLLPDLSKVARVNSSLIGEQNLPSFELVTYLTIYILAYCALLLVLATIINESREFP